MKLYHGTTTKALRGIRRQGIKPRGKNKPGNWGDQAVPSHPDRVYLTTAYAAYYAINAADFDGSNACVVEVDIDPHAHWLLPDEDMLEQLFRGEDGMEGDDWPLKRRCLHYQTHADHYNWEPSLKAMGTVAVAGAIPPECLTRYVILRRSNKMHMRLMMAAMDPTITIDNYRLLGHYYRNLTSLLFGDPATAEPYEGLEMMADHGKRIIANIDFDRFKVQSFRKENAYG